MSTVAADNWTPSAGGTATTFTGGLAKAWASYTGAATAALDESYNVGSLTDNGVGQYQSNLTNAMNTSTFPTIAMSTGNVGASRDNTITRTASLIATEAKIGVDLAANDALIWQVAHGTLA